MVHIIYDSQKKKKNVSSSVVFYILLVVDGVMGMGQKHFDEDWCHFWEFYGFKVQGCM